MFKTPACLIFGSGSSLKNNKPHPVVEQMITNGSFFCLFVCFRFVLRLELTPHGATSHTPVAPSAATQWAETSRLPLPWSLWSPLSPANQWTSRQKIRVRGKTTKWRTPPTNPSWARLDSFIDLNELIIFYFILIPTRQLSGAKSQTFLCFFLPLL